MRPNFSLKQVNMSIFNAFVKPFASCASIEQYTTSIMPFVTCSLMKWNLVSLCLLLPCVIGFMARFIADLLLIFSFSGFFTSQLSSFITLSSQIAWSAANVLAMYSAKHDDRAVIGCFLVHHEIPAPLNLNR